MGNKNTFVIIIAMVAMFAVGIFVGWLIWGTSNCSMMTKGAHMMPGGAMMDDNMMSGGGMQEMMEGMTKSLVGKTGDAFDAAFLGEMIIHHEGAVDMAELVLKNSTRRDLIDLANNIITAQTNEIDMMKNWQKEWFSK